MSRRSNIDKHLEIKIFFAWQSMINFVILNGNKNVFCKVFCKV